MILIYSLGVILLIGILIYYLIWKDRLNDKLNLDKDWNKFLKSVELNDIKGIASNGDKLIWNKYLKSEQLNTIIKVVDLRVSNYPEL
ncbi:hypothetical protein [Flavobacterium okayamense]|uniref:Uncharacterized protein n=1 Tax=Flavobacterium okayamense TaxID=2830782 RepID=A0ABM7S6J9_9FLAO|nr:hypothetical protein [Flavobacterium okayamense]BCY29189.1 hypothetical protein KK2020170_20570 [Flavobacterium okayamense]